MGIHDWIDLAAIVGLFASTVVGVLLANRLAKHQALEDKLSNHEGRLTAAEKVIDWISRTFKPS